MSKHHADQVLLGGSFHCANIIQIKFIAGMVSFSERCINEANLLLNSQAGVLALSA